MSDGEEIVQVVLVETDDEQPMGTVDPRRKMGSQISEWLGRGVYRVAGLNRYGRPFAGEVRIGKVSK